MRKFIVSDLHGNLEMYVSIINYLENISKYDNVKLYILGDLIDRGIYSGNILFDVYDRIKNNRGFEIDYLAGNHELMMYQASKRLKYNQSFYSFPSLWDDNGGSYTFGFLEDMLSFEDMMRVIDFISNLNIYELLDEKIRDKNIVLAHAMCPNYVYNKCNYQIKDDNYEVLQTLWGSRHPDVKRKNLGNKNYFTIIGHTPVGTSSGFMYDKFDNVLNIDGGCAPYSYAYLHDMLLEDGCGKNDYGLLDEKRYNYFSSFDHTPLVEVMNDKLRILTFNNNNEITCGNYFNGRLDDINEEELNGYRNNLNDTQKVKKLIKM